MNKLDLKEFSVDMTEEEYHEHPNISYSDINKYIREGFSCLRNLREHITTDAFIEGSIIDTMITDSSHFHDKYAIASLQELTPGLKNTFNVLIDKGYKSLTEVTPEVAKDAARSVDYRRTNTPETVKRYLNDYANEFEIMAINRGKEMITSQQYEMAIKCNNAINDNALLRFIAYGNDDIELYNQLKFFVTYNDVPYKFMPDIIHVDHVRKIVRIYDLKSTRHSACDFPKSYIEYNYWIQQWLYTLLLKSIIYDAGYTDYDVIWGGFLVVSKKDYTALLWNNNDINKLIKGEDITVDYPNPTLIGKEIFDYQQNQSIYPNWVNCFDSNDINYYLKINNIK